MLALSVRSDVFLGDGGLARLSQRLERAGHDVSRVEATWPSEAEPRAAFLASLERDLGARELDAVVLHRAWDAPTLSAIRRAIGPAAKLVRLGTGTAALLELMTAAGGDVIGIDHRQSLGAAWQRVGHDHGVQGNLDAARLLAGWEATEAGALHVLDEAGGRPGHIFNLGHGVLPATDTGLLCRLVDFVHSETARPAVAAGAGQ